jgi:hypothetical protein
MRVDLLEMPCSIDVTVIVIVVFDGDGLTVLIIEIAGRLLWRCSSRAPTRAAQLAVCAELLLQRDPPLLVALERCFLARLVDPPSQRAIRVELLLPARIAFAIRAATPESPPTLQAASSSPLRPPHRTPADLPA